MVNLMPGDKKTAVVQSAANDYYKISGGKALYKHYVTFFSPGTIVAETTIKEINTWDVEKAIEMSKSIKERYGALPYGFQFSTRERIPNDFDSKETKTSNMYYLGGEIFSLEDIKARNDPKDKILISNMEHDGYDRVIQNDRSWRWSQPLNKGDIVLGEVL